MKHITTILFVLLFITNSQSQNNPKYFKTIPLLNNETPEWALLMYSENPNVGEVEKLFKQYYKENSFVKNIHTQNHKYWMLQIEELLNQNGYIQPLTKQSPLRENLPPPAASLISPLSIKALSPRNSADLSAIASTAAMTVSTPALGIVSPESPAKLRFTHVKKYSPTPSRTFLI